MMFKAVLLATLVTIASAHSAYALDSAQILPAGINSPAFRYGIVSGIDKKYTGSGSLVTLTDYNAKEFDAREIVAQDSRAENLVTILNSYGPDKYGDELNWGVFKIETKPEIKYFAPLLARGVTDRLTVAVGLPIFTYRNDIALTESGSNTAAIHDRVGHNVEAINEAFATFDAGVTASVRKNLADKGYKPLETRDEQITGDMQLAALYSIMNTRRLVLTARTILTLPTGPKDDPDDLTDLTMFGETALEPALIANYNLTSRWQLASKLAYRWTAPDSALMRVPVDETDGIPAANRKENLQRNLGDSFNIGASFFYKLLPGFRAGLGAEMVRKGMDSYYGSNGWRYDLLSRNTSSEADRVRAGLEYSSTESYMQGKAYLPLMVNYDFNDTIAGRNTERRTLHELTLTLFF